MKKIEVIFRPEKLEPLKETLLDHKKVPADSERLRHLQGNLLYFSMLSLDTPEGKSGHFSLRWLYAR